MIAARRGAWLAGIVVAGLWPVATYAQSSVYCSDEPKTRPKVIGGSPADQKQWPWFAALILKDAQSNVKNAWCGGTMVARNWVLTAAHCLADLDPVNLSIKGFGRLEVVVGIDDLREARPEDVYAAEDIVIPPEYAAAQTQYLIELAAYDDKVRKKLPAVRPIEPAQRIGFDIGLVRIGREWTGPLAPLSFESATDPTKGTAIKVAGFGLVKPRSPFQADPTRSYKDRSGSTVKAGCARLMQVSMPIVDTTACLARFKGPGFSPTIGDAQVCAGYEKPGIDSCNGDSGGPLMAIDGRGQPYQVGLVSWGIPNCGGQNKPYGVYTRLSAQAEWLTAQVGDVRLVDREAVHMAQSVAGLRSMASNAVKEIESESAIAAGSGRIRLLNAGSADLRVKLNAVYRFEIKSEVSGRLIVIDIDADGQVTQIFPNRFISSPELLRVTAGETVVVPTKERFGFDHFKAADPVGEGKLVLMVVPDDFPVELTLGAELNEQRHKGFKPVVSPIAYLMNALDQMKTQATATRTAGASGPRAPRPSWGFTAVNYTIER